MFYIHGDVGKGRSIDIYYPPIHWSVKPFMIFKGLAYMTADGRLSWGSKIFVVG